MNTPQFQQVPIGDIVPTSDNQRKNIEKSEGFDELVASIKAGGVRQVVQVRPHPVKKGKYELRAGERRYRAAKAAGVETIPAIVYTSLSDAEAMDLTYIENKFRMDLKPMEEAAEIALLIERFGGDVKAIAERIGKKERWVRLRANINKNLIKPWKAIFENIDKHPEFKSWSIKHLTLIARLPAARQKQLLADMDDYYNRPEKMSSSDLKDYIAKELKLLSGAKWELGDETLLPKAGACSKCEKRSGHQPMLWFDSDDQVDAGDQCLDGHCYQAKEIALLQRTAAELREKHPELVLALTNPTRGIDAQAITEKMGAPLSPHQYSTCSKSTKGAVPAMYVNGKGAGKLTYVKVDAGGSGRAGKPKGTPTPLKKRREMHDAKRWAQVLIDLRVKAEKTKVEGLTFTDKITALMALVAAYGNKPLWNEYSIRYNPEKRKVSRAEVSKLTKPKADKKRSLDLLWQSFQPTVDGLLTYHGPITQTPKKFIDDSKWIADMIGADIKAMFKEVSGRKGFTEPKSWAKLNADGTVKQVKSKKAKVKKAKVKKAKVGKAEVRSCRVCGCTNDKPCLDEKTGEPCCWVEKDLCSNCEANAVEK